MSKIRAAIYINNLEEAAMEECDWYYSEAQIPENVELVRWYRDISGEDEQLEFMMDDAKRDIFDMVLVMRMTYFSTMNNSTIQLYDKLSRLLEAGVGVYFLEEQIQLWELGSLELLKECSELETELLKNKKSSDVKSASIYLKHVLMWEKYAQSLCKPELGYREIK